LDRLVDEEGCIVEGPVFEAFRKVLLISAIGLRTFIGNRQGVGARQGVDGQMAGLEALMVENCEYVCWLSSTRATSLTRTIWAPELS